MERDRAAAGRPPEPDEAGPPGARAGAPASGGEDSAEPALRLVVPRRILAALGVTALVLVIFLVWRIAQLFLVIFAAVLFTILLDGMIRLLMRHLRIPRLAALGLLVVATVGVLLLFSLAGGPELADQVVQLVERIPEVAGQLQERLRQTSWGRLVLRQTPEAGELLRSGAALMGQVPTLFSNVTAVLTNLVFVLLIGLYAAIDPDLYVRGALTLVPRRGRERAAEVLGALGHALRWWLIGRFSTMVVVGVLTAVGLWIVGIPLAFALGAIAGLFSFVPFVGPIASSIPAILIALGTGLTETLWVVAVYVGVQFVEGNLITPVIQQRVVSLPPAVLLSSQLVMGILFGLVGVLLATPLTVVVMVLVQVLYVQQTLHDEIDVLGESVG